MVCNSGGRRTRKVPRPTVIGRAHTISPKSIFVCASWHFWVPSTQAHQSFPSAHPQNCDFTFSSHDHDNLSTTTTTRQLRDESLGCAGSIAIMAPRSYSKTYKVPRRRKFSIPSTARNRVTCVVVCCHDGVGEGEGEICYSTRQRTKTDILCLQHSSRLVCTFYILATEH